MGFGAHTHYRLTVTNDTGTGTWQLWSVLPLTLTTVVANPMYAYQSYPETVSFPNKYSLITQVGPSSIIRSSSLGNWENITTGEAGLDGSWGSTALDHWGILEFPYPVYVPIWLVMDRYQVGTENLVTGIDFHYSDNGLDWTLAKSFSDSSMFTANVTYQLFNIGDEATLKPYSEVYTLNGVSSVVGGKTFRSVLRSSVELRTLTTRYSLSNNPAAQFKASLGDVEWRLSGGSGNTDPSASLGGGISLQSISSQIATAKDVIPGVSIVSASNNTRGFGTIFLLIDSAGDKWLDWQPSGEISGGSVLIQYDGRYTLFSGRGSTRGYLSVDVDFSNLLDLNSEWPVYIENSDDQVFGDVGKAEAAAGSTQYRCLYLHNGSSTGKLQDLYVYLKLDTFSPSTIEVGVDASGPTYGSGAVTIVDQYTAPAGVSFSQPTLDNPLVVGEIVWGRDVPIWVKRTIPQYTTRSVAKDLSIIGYGARL